MKTYKITFGTGKDAETATDTNAFGLITALKFLAEFGYKIDSITKIEVTDAAPEQKMTPLRSRL